MVTPWSPPSSCHQVLQVPPSSCPLLLALVGGPYWRHLLAAPWEVLVWEMIPCFGGSVRGGKPAAVYLALCRLSVCLCVCLFVLTHRHHIKSPDPAPDPEPCPPPAPAPALHPNQFSRSEQRLPPPSGGAAAPEKRRRFFQRRGGGGGAVLARLRPLPKRPRRMLVIRSRLVPHS